MRRGSARERQPLLQLRERRLDAGARVEPLRELQLGVGVRHRDQLAQRAALRHAQRHAAAGALAEQLAQRVRRRRARPRRSTSPGTTRSGTA